jgi:amino acid adenylation domain-containing protein
MAAEDDEHFVVVRSVRGDYSLLPAGLGVPEGWSVVGDSALRVECLDRIRDQWRDIEIPALCRPHPNPPYPRGRGLVARVCEQAQRNPSAAAVIEGTSTFTYRQLDQRSDRLAYWLRDLGAVPGSVIAVAFDCGYDLVTAILGTWKTGAACVLLDISAPGSRNRHIVADADALALLTNTDLTVSGVTSSDLTHLPDRPGTAQQVVRAPQGSDPLAYITYTSGSTGEPKGVAMGESTLVNMVDWEVDRMASRALLRGGIAPGPRAVLHYLRPTVDVTYQEIFSTLSNGDFLVAVTGLDSRADPQYVIELMARHGVQRAYLPVMALGQLARASMELKLRLRLWEVITMGSKFRATGEIRDFFASLDNPVLDDQYGSAEMQTVFGCLYSGDPGQWPSGSVFTETIPSVRIVLRDADGGVLSDNGEICAGGIAPSRGYAGQPERTAERFVPDPEPPFPGARLYRSGDFGRRRVGGGIEIQGRADDQIKLRGFRIDLGDVEQNLLRIAGVARCAVVTTGEEEHKRLIAYVVPDEHGRQLTPAILGRDLRTVLPDYLIPDAFVLIDDLPLTPNGKVERRLLTRWEGGGLDPAGLSQTEILVGQLWSEVLGARIRGADADFFTVGGNSVLATTIIARLRQHFGKDLPFGCLFEHPRLRDLAKLIEDTPAMKLREILPAPAGDPVEAVPAQAGLLLHAELAEDPSVYNVSWAYRVHGPVHEELLREALDFVIGRHEVLRTVFDDEDGVPTLDVLQHCTPGYFEVLEVGEEQALQVVEQRRRKPFDTRRGPLHRTVLLRLGHDEHIVLFTGHHVVFDSWSENLFRTELGTVYRTLFSHDVPELLLPSMGYRDYAAWLAECLEGGDFDRQQAYWTTQLAGVSPELRLSTRRPRSAETSDTAASVPMGLGRELSRRLRAIAVREKVTPFTLLLAVFGLALGRLTEAPEVVVGVPASGRTAAELQEVIGFFVNSLPIRMETAGVESFGGMLNVVRTAVAGAFVNQDLPFERIVRASAVPRVPGANPLFQAWFVFDDFVEELDLAGSHAVSLPLRELTVRFDLALHVRHAGDELLGEFTYREDLFHQADIELLERQFQLVAEEAVADDGARP